LVFENWHFWGFSEVWRVTPPFSMSRGMETENNNKNEVFQNFIFQKIGLG